MHFPPSLAARRHRRQTRADHGGDAVEPGEEHPDHDHDQQQEEGGDHHAAESTAHPEVEETRHRLLHQQHEATGARIAGHGAGEAHGGSGNTEEAHQAAHHDHGADRQRGRRVPAELRAFVVRVFEVRRHRNVLHLLQTQPAEGASTFCAFHVITPSTFDDAKVALRAGFAAIVHLLGRHLIDMVLLPHPQFVEFTVSLLHRVGIAVLETITFAAARVLAVHPPRSRNANLSVIAVRTLPTERVLFVELEFVEFVPNFSVDQLVQILLVDALSTGKVAVIGHRMKALEIDDAVADLVFTKSLEALCAKLVLTGSQREALVDGVFAKADIAKICRLEGGFGGHSRNVRRQGGGEKERARVHAVDETRRHSTSQSVGMVWVRWFWDATGDMNARIGLTRIDVELNVAAVGMVPFVFGVWVGC